MDKVAQWYRYSSYRLGTVLYRNEWSFVIVGLLGGTSLFHTYLYSEVEPAVGKQRDHSRSGSAGTIGSWVYSMGTPLMAKYRNIGQLKRKNTSNRSCKLWSPSAIWTTPCIKVMNRLFLSYLFIFCSGKLASTERMMRYPRCCDQDHSVQNQSAF